MTQERLAAWVGPGVVAVLVAAFFWKLLTRQYTWMDHPDMAYQVLPWLQFQASSWHRGEFPLWDPHVWGGQPLIGQMQPGAAYPLNWILFLLPLSAEGTIQTFWVNLYFVFTHILAGLFAYALCRDLQRTRSASILGGVAFSTAGVAGSLGWPQMLNGAIWIPLVLLFVFRVWRGESRVANASLAGGFLGISFLSGHHQIPIFALFTAFVLWGCLIARMRRSALRPALAFFCATILTAAFQAIPAFETGLRSIRWVGSQNPVFWGQPVPYLVHDRLSLQPVEWLGLLVAGPRQESFVGLSLAVLAAIGLAAGYRKTVEVRLLGIVLLTGTALAMGGWIVFHGIAYLVVPLFEKARTPAMALVIAQTAIAVLAAFGLDQLRTCRVPIGAIQALAALGALPWLFVAVIGALDPPRVASYQHLAVAALVSAVMALLLFSLRSGLLSHDACQRVVIALVLAELGTVIGRDYRHRESPGGFLASLEQGTEIANFLRSQGDFIRLEVDTEAVPFNIGDWQGIDQFRAYLGGMTANVAPIENDRLAGGARAMQLFALTHFVGKAPSRPGQIEVFQGRSGLRVYRNPDAARASRLWIEPLDGGAADCSRAADLAVTARHAQRLSIKADIACGSLLVLSQTWFPGWQARVDGQSVPIREIHGVLQGVPLSAGAHTVDFVYRPVSAYGGAALTFAGLIAMALAGRALRETRPQR